MCCGYRSLVLFASPATATSFLYSDTDREPRRCTAECDFCGTRVAYPFHCRYCGGDFCPDHRLPSAHDCIGEAVWQNTPSPHSVDFTRLKDGHVKADQGKERSGTYTPVKRDASAYARRRNIPRTSRIGSVDMRLIVAAVLIIIAIVVLLFIVL